MLLLIYIVVRRVVHNGHVYLQMIKSIINVRCINTMIRVAVMVEAMFMHETGVLAFSLSQKHRYRMIYIGLI